MKVYIAQPMQNVDDYAIRTHRKYAEAYVKSKHSNVEFINNYRPEWSSDHIPPLEALGKALELLAHADIAYFLPTWEESRGCTIEADCCTMYGIPMAVVPFPEWQTMG